MEDDDGTQVKTVEANGLRFAYLEHGEGPLVLLVHGFPDTAHSWDATRPALAAAGYRAVSPFTRGIAPTAQPADGDYRVSALADDIAALIEALGEEQAIVVGHDWGAAASFAAAVAHPERFRMLFAVAIPHPASIRPTPALVWKARHFLAFRLPGAVARTRADDYAYIDELVRRWSPSWSPGPEETAPVKRAYDKPGSLEAALGYYRQAGPPQPGYRGSVTVPTIAFAGADDPNVDPAVFEQAARYHRDSYEAVVLPGGHFLHREHPEPFNRALLARLPQVG